MIIKKSKENPIYVLQKNSFGMRIVRQIEIERYIITEMPLNGVVENVEKNWWIYLNLAAQHYYYVGLKVKDVDIWSRLFIPLKGYESVLCTLTKLFFNVQCSIIETDLNAEKIVAIQVCGLLDMGKEVFDLLKSRDSFSKETAAFYNVNAGKEKGSNVWDEGLYFIEAESEDKGYESVAINELMTVPYFRSLDVTPFSHVCISECNFLRYILSKKSAVYMYVDKISDSICTKSLLWLT